MFIEGGVTASLRLIPILLPGMWVLVGSGVGSLELSSFGRGHPIWGHQTSPAGMDAQLSPRCGTKMVLGTLGDCGWPESPGSISICLWLLGVIIATAHPCQIHFMTNTHTQTLTFSQFMAQQCVQIITLIVKAARQDRNKKHSTCNVENQHNVS